MWFAVFWVVGVGLVVSMAVGLARARSAGDRYEPRHLAAPAPEVHHERDFYGSMDFYAEVAWRPLSMQCSSPQTARIKAGDDLDGDQTAAWFHGLGEDPGPGVDRPPPPGPVQDPPIRGDDQGRVVRAGAPDPRPAARADLTGSLLPRQPENDPGPAAHAGPGLERLADTDDIAQARGWPTVRDMDADVADWLAGRAVTWARLEIGVLT